MATEFQLGDNALRTERERHERTDAGLGHNESRTGSNTTAKGIAGSESTTGAAESWPVPNTWKTSMSFPFAFVVTISCEPSGVKATCPGVVVNWGVSVGIKVERPVEPRDRHNGAEDDPVALHRTAVLGIEDIDEIAVHGDADGKAPPEGESPSV